MCKQRGAARRSEARSGGSVLAFAQACAPLPSTHHAHVADFGGTIAGQQHIGALDLQGLAGVPWQGQCKRMHASKE